ncbi:MAG: hypothetical protein NZO58_07890 [Gemmataceae bacterium]|nr:hypothetical protein [Gemmataceae bacterium]
MEGLLQRIDALERRTLALERKLRTWRSVALVVMLVALAGIWVVPSQAQQGIGFGTGATFTAPFVVTGTGGAKLLEVNEFFERTGDGSQDALLTLYRNGRPAAMFRTTGKLYKDAYDPADSYLNVVETWLYRYPRDAQGRIEPTPYLVASTALTRGGGSIAVFSEQGRPTATPPMAARLTAKRGVGGAVMLFDQAGNEGRIIQTNK